MATVNGTPENDTLTGTASADVLCGLVGNDRLLGGTGDDKLFGGKGNFSDTLVGGNGEDTLRGNDGNDSLGGGAGNDKLFGGRGNDRLNGGNGNDILTGSTSNLPGEKDTLTGGAGADLFILGNANEVFYDDGNSTMAGESDYALITDFNTANDVIELNGANNNYVLATSPSGLAAGTAIYLNKPSSELDELIAIVQGSTNLSLDSDYFKFTNPNPPAAEFNLSDLDGTNGFVLNGAGSAVSDAGDVNGDGFDDVIIGSSGADKSYVVFGQVGGFDASFDLSDLDGSNGFVVEKNLLNNPAVSGAGDVNGDGFDDIIIGNDSASPNNQQSAGQSYVVFGKEGFKARFDLSDLDGRNGFAINGSSSYDVSGGSVSNTGDVNGDGFDDIIIGALATLTDAYTQFTIAKNYVVFGNTEGFEASFINLSDLNGRNGFIFEPGGGDYSGTTQYAGDINGDGFDDILFLSTAIPDNPNSPSAGSTYVVFGKAEGFEASFSSRLDGSNGFAIREIAGDGTLIGPVSGVGDINSDGFDDLIIGTINTDFNDQQSDRSSYVVFGKSEGFESSFDLSNINGTNGFVINGIDPGGFLDISVSGAGDVNSDGFDDILIGTRSADPNSQENAGSSYVIFGTGSFDASFDLSDLNGTNGFVINGIDAGNGLGNSVSAAGDVNSDGFDDLIIGARGAGSSYVIFGRADFTSFVAAA